jgi:hypothetical protein
MYCLAFNNIFEFPAGMLWKAATTLVDSGTFSGLQGLQILCGACMQKLLLLPLELTGEITILFSRVSFISSREEEHDQNVW